MPHNWISLPVSRFIQGGAAAGQPAAAEQPGCERKRGVSHFTEQESMTVLNSEQNSWQLVDREQNCGYNFCLARTFPVVSHVLTPERGS
jgi:hypothetical protein